MLGRYKKIDDLIKDVEDDKIKGASKGTLEIINHFYADGKFTNNCKHIEKEYQD